jgi:hypothetical protein
MGKTRIFGLLYGGYKVTTKSQIIPISEIDLMTGQVLLEEEEEVEACVNDNHALGLLQKLWDKVF